MKPWKVMLATAVIFIAGLVTGAVLVTKTQPKPPRAAPYEAFLQGPYYIQRQFLNRMKVELNLTPEQIVNIERIFAGSRERIKILNEVIGPELREELAAVHLELQAELTAEQKEAFEKLLRRTRPRTATGRRQSDSDRLRGRVGESNRQPAKPSLSPGKTQTQ